MYSVQCTMHSVQCTVYSTCIILYILYTKNNCKKLTRSNVVAHLPKLICHSFSLLLDSLSQLHQCSMVFLSKIISFIKSVQQYHRRVWFFLPNFAIFMLVCTLYSTCPVSRAGRATFVLRCDNAGTYYAFCGTLNNNSILVPKS